MRQEIQPSELSHGMRKRATIAQALLGRPEIVMLDEATAGLDPANAKEIRAIVAEQAGDVNFILSSHDLSELERLCDQVLYLENGQLKQHKTLNIEGDSRFITLRMKQDFPQIIPAILQLQGVSQVNMTQDREYLLTITNHPGSENVEMDLLLLLQKNSWSYAQFINGKTLENQLF